MLEIGDIVDFAFDEEPEGLFGVMFEDLIEISELLYGFFLGSLFCHDIFFLVLIIESIIFVWLSAEMRNNINN